MSLLRTEVVHVSISSPAIEVLAFLGDLENWRSWAPWIRSVNRAASRVRELDTEAGHMTVRFVEPNPVGVLDHDVTLESGLTARNSMRVLPNGSGSEVLMLLFQSPGVSNEEFARDIQAVTDDLARLKRVVEQ